MHFFDIFGDSLFWVESRGGFVIHFEAKRNLGFRD